MKKGIIIIFVIILFVCFLNFITDKYTNNSVNLVCDSLNELEENLLLDDKNMDNINNLLEKLKELWESRNSKLEYYIEHEELEKVSTNIYKIIGYINNELYDEAIPEIEGTKFILNHLKHKYEFSFKNLF